MHPRALQKLWTKTKGVLPYLSRADFEAIAAANVELQDVDGIHYWGVVDRPVRYRGHSLLHCYNFGNTSVKFPWQAQLVNFGRSLPVRVVSSGTIRVRDPGNAMLDQYARPFLVFGFEADAAAADLIEQGMILTDGEPVNQHREYLVAIPGGKPAPVSDGVLFYYMMKRVPFTVEAADHWVAPGASSGVPAFRMKLQYPMLLEPGWPVLLLEKDHWVWGIVVQ